MPRTPAEIDIFALELTATDKAKFDALPEEERTRLQKPAMSPIEVTVPEAQLLVEQNRLARRAHGKIMPEARHVMKKLRSGRAQIHGHHVVVKD